MWESEAPAELAPQRFGRSLTLPVNEFVAQSRFDDVYRDDLALPVKANPPLTPRRAKAYIYIDFAQTRMLVCRLDFCVVTQPTKVAGTLRRAVRLWTFTGSLGGRHMECAYYVDFCRLYLSSIL